FYETWNTIDEIKILNTVGEILVQTKIKSMIDVSSIQNGIYFVMVKTAKGNIFNQKIIILR
ncbi:MAG: T9SS type A sorting domain-containing protein, partial [Chitinophagales bacterium]